MFNRLDVSTATWNPDLSSWDTSKVRAMSWMFYLMNTFNNDSISNWDTSNVTKMEGMFLDATIFDQDLTGWCVSKISQEPGSQPGANPQTRFSGDSALSNSNKPNWGAPC